MDVGTLTESTQFVSRKSRLAFFGAAAIVAGALLRFWMLRHFFEVNGDSLIYGGIAKNLLLHGKYALTTGAGETYPTLIRLPGYPFFLAGCFSLFGMENYRSAAIVQIVLELLGCVLLADAARRIAPARLRAGAAQCTLWLAALCPFTAIYAANPLAESPTLFAFALGLWAAVRFQDRPAWNSALCFTLAATYAALLRPDGALFGVVFAPALFVGLWQKSIAGRQAARIVIICVLLAMVPFAAWTWRNWRTFHVFEPLAPRYATDPDEAAKDGWESWVKTWCLDFVSTYEIYWSVPDDVLDVQKLPSRAFDSPAQYAETVALAEDYNSGDKSVTPEIDARFAKLARDRVAAHPFRSHVLLPIWRVADMWLRPRVENLPIDLDWWVYSHHHVETRFSWAYAALNAGYLLLALVGLCMRARLWPWMLGYIVLRSVMLLSIGAPEARYTLECFPMIFVLGGVGFYLLMNWVLLSVLKVKASEGRG
jgi:hypothetical protein